MVSSYQNANCQRLRNVVSSQDIRFFANINNEIISLPIRVICVVERSVCSSTLLTCLIKTVTSFSLTNPYKLDITVPIRANINNEIISLPIRVICVDERSVCSSTLLTCLIKTFNSFSFTFPYKLDHTVSIHGKKLRFTCVLITDAAF